MKKILKWCLIILVIGILGFFIHSDFNIMYLRNDSGWDSSYGGGGYSGGYSDYGGYDYDYDYDYFDYNNDYSSSSSKNRNTKFDLIIILIVWIVTIYFVFVFFKNSEKSNRAVIRKKLQQEKMFEELRKVNDAKLAELMNKDILFIKREIFDTYKDIQIAWMNFDYDKLATLCGDELYNTYMTQLETLKLKGQKNIMEDFFIQDIYFNEIKSLEDVIYITVTLKVKQRDYVVDKENKVVFGNKNKFMIMTYSLDFECREVSTNLCPNCNAKIKSETSKCDYCGAVIVQGKGKWILIRKDAIGQE